MMQEIPKQHILVSPPLFGFVAPQKRSEYVHAQFERALAQGGFLIIRGKGGALIELAPFESECFGQTMGKITWMWGPLSCSTHLIDAILSEIRQYDLAHLAICIEANQVRLIQAFERSGFYLVDNRVMLVHPLPKEKENPCLKNEKVDISPFRIQDLDAIQCISSNAFTLSRFYADPNLPTQYVDELHRRWILNDCNGRADLVLVARDGERVLGYIACIYQAPQADFELPAHSEIDLIAVAPDARGLGIGTKLIDKVLHYYSGRATRVIVETQGSNYPALNLYLKCGFQLVSLAVTLHWFREAPYEGVGDCCSS